MERSKPLEVFFYRTATGNEPVREWLQSLTKTAKKRIGVDIWKAQSEWPIGMPQVKPLGNGLYEIRSRLPDGIARVIFMLDGNAFVLLHGFIKKTQKRRRRLLSWRRKGDLIMSGTRKTNSRRGSKLESFLKEEGIHEEVLVQAEKEIVAWKLLSAMKERKMTVTVLARKMKTSRAAVNRILDPANPSITLNTLEKAALVLGKRWRFDLVDARAA